MHQNELWDDSIQFNSNEKKSDSIQFNSNLNRIWIVSKSDSNPIQFNSIQMPSDPGDDPIQFKIESDFESIQIRFKITKIIQNVGIDTSEAEN